MYEQFSTPCYIFNRNDYEKNIKMFMKSLNEYFGDNWILGYSFKTNYLPYVLRCAKENGCYAEVVSKKEYELAKKVGFENQHIIFNGPIKDKNSFLESIINYGIVNIDSKRELEWLDELPKDTKFKIGIRVNFDLESELPGQTLMGDEGGRFGFCDDNEELSEAISKIKKYDNIQLKYLHMHVSSKSKSVEIYEHLVKRACNIIDKEKLEIDYIDVGGSFFGGGDDGSSYTNYVKAIKNVLNLEGKSTIGIIVEPGASLIASCFSYLIEVVDNKETKQNNYVVTDGSRLHIDPFFARNKYSYQLISKNDITDIEQTIAGFTCMEKDRIMKLKDENRLTVGDRILFKTVGSYTMCMNSDFISSEPRVYAQYNGSNYLVRKEKEIMSYFENDVLEVI